MMKKRIGDESKVSMPLFLGFVGLFGMVVLLPGFPILHFTGLERFELPDSRRVAIIILVGTMTLRLFMALTWDSRSMPLYRWSPTSLGHTLCF